jgi:hypothetical protein
MAKGRGVYRVKGFVCSTPLFKKQRSENYKVKRIQVEDEVIDISGWSISPCYCHLVGGSGVHPPLFDKFLRESARGHNGAE